MKQKVKINSNDFYESNRFVNHTEIRNTVIRSIWEGLKYTELSYKKRTEIICKTFYMSENLVERIITRNC